ncbi:DNA polymerase phi, partial [Phenoliferia sp. Uapishka_3]
MTSILPLFPLLSSHDPPTRLDASLSLIQLLPLDAAPAPNQNDADTKYAIKRLVTGLGSSNEASRQGFAVALAELLARLPVEQANDVLPLILTSSTPATGHDSREERDLLFARLLGLHAVLRSGVVYRPEATNGETFKDVILALLALSGKKSWIREPAYWVLIEGVRTLLNLTGEADVPAWREDIGQWIIQRLLVDSREKARGWSPEKISLVLVLQACGVEADYVTVLSPTFPSGNPLARTSLTQLAQALKGSANEGDSSAAGPSAPKMGSNAVKTAKGGAAAPGAAPHFVWSEIFDLYFPAETKVAASTKSIGVAGRAQWPDVWRILVDQSLFAVPSLPSKATGFALLSLAIQRLPPAEVPVLFGEGVMRTFTNHLRKSADGEKTLTRVAEKVAASLPIFLTANPTISLPLLLALVAPPHGSPAFDHRTVERVVAKLDIKGVRGWVKYLRELALGEDKTIEDGAEPTEVVDDEKSIAARRLWAFDQLLHVVKAGNVPKDDELIASLLEFFAVLGWFEVRKSGKGARSYIPVPAFTEPLQTASRSRFFSIVTALPTTPSPSGLTWLSRALSLLDNLSADTKHFNSIIESDAEVLESRTEVRAIYAKLAGAGDERKQTARSLVEGVLLLSYDEGEEASEALEGLKDCIPTLFPNDVPARTSAPEEDEEMDSNDDGEEPEPATVLIDLLLELLHRPSAFIKSVAQTVFTGFAEEIGEQGMELILEQIRPEEREEDEKTEEDAPMTNGDGHDHAESSTSKAKGKKARVESEDESEEEEDDFLDADDDESEDGDVEVDDEFRNALLAALQANGVADEFDAAEENDEDEDEDLLDDDQMMAMDEKLADIFKLQSGEKKGKKGFLTAERMDDLHYRLRVVDLLESLVKHHSTNPLLVLVPITLFSIIRQASTVEKELQAKAIKLLRQLVAARKDIPAPSSPQLALDALEELHTLSHTVDVPELATLCSQTSIYLVKAALNSPAADASTSNTIVQLFGDSFEHYLSTKNSKTRVQPFLTVEFCRRAPAGAWPLFGRLVKLAAGETSSGTANAYRRMQAFEVAQALLASYAGLKTDVSKAGVLAAMPSYRNTLFNVLSSSATDPATIFDAARLKEVAKFALTAVRTTSAATTPEATRALWNADEFATVLEQFQTSDRFKGAVAIQSIIKQLVAVLGGGKPTKVAGVKRKSVEEPVKETAKAATATKKSKKSKQSAPEVEVEIEVEDAEEEEDVPVADVKSGKRDKKDKKERKKEKKRQAAADK